VATRGLAGFLAALAFACSDRSPIRIDVVLSSDDRAVLIGIEHAGSFEVVAMDPAAPMPALPDPLLHYKEEPITIWVFGYDQTFQDNSIAVDPGPVQSAMPGPLSRTIKPYARASVRTRSGGVDSGFGPVTSLSDAASEFLLPLAPGCFSLALTPIPLSPDTGIALVASPLDADHALLVVETQTSTTWIEVDKNGPTTIPSPIPAPFKPTAGALGADGTVALIGTSSTGARDAWARAPGSTTFVRLPLDDSLNILDHYLGVAVGSSGAIWLGTSIGTVRRFSAGAFGPVIPAPPTWNGGTMTQLVPVGADGLDVILPHVYAPLAPRTIESIRGSKVSSFAAITSTQPHAIGRSDDLGRTFLGDTVGHLTALDAEAIDTLPTMQPTAPRSKRSPRFARGRGRASCSAAPAACSVNISRDSTCAHRVAGRSTSGSSSRSGTCS
jgi:hypothetical protein